MHATGTTKGHQGKLTRVVSPLDRNDPDGALHVGVGHAHDAFGQIGHRQARALSKIGRHPFGACAVDRHAATKEIVGVEAAQQQVRVGDRQLFTHAVTDGTRRSPGTARPHPQRATGIEIRDRAAAGTHGVNIDHRQAYGKVAHTRIRCAPDAAVDQADIGGRPPHVESNHTPQPRGLGDSLGADHTRSGTG